MIIPLDSPRWNSLRHAYGIATDTPELIRAIWAEVKPNYHDGGAWFELYSSLVHQHSTYSATYAAVPHLLALIETGTIEQRAAVLCLAGELLIFGNADEAIPDDLRPAFRDALDLARRHSLAIVREAGRANILDPNMMGPNLGDLIQAFGGLRHSTSGYVVQLGYIVREGWRVEVLCPLCREVMLIRWRDDDLTIARINMRGHDESATALPARVDRSQYCELIERGILFLHAQTASWPVENTPEVLAALAQDCADPRLANCILDLRTVITCPYCLRPMELHAGIYPVS